MCALQLEIWGSDRSTYITSNDDADGGRGSHIDWTCSTTGTYYVAVRGYSRSQRGSYTINAAAAGAPGGAADPCTAIGTSLHGESQLEGTSAQAFGCLSPQTPPAFQSCS